MSTFKPTRTANPYVVNVTNFDPSQVAPLNFEKITSGGKGAASVDFFEARFRYRFPLPSGGVKENKLSVQLGDYTIDSGIQAPNPKFAGEGPGRPSMKLEFQETHQKADEQFFVTVFVLGSEAVMKNRGKLGAFGKKCRDLETTKSLMSQPLYYKTNEDGDRDEAISACKFLNLDSYDGVINSLFNVPCGVKIVNGKKCIELKPVDPLNFYGKTIFLQ